MAIMNAFLSVVLAMTLVICGCKTDEEKKMAHLEKGVAYVEKGDYRSASLEFKNAIQLDPQFVAAYAHLGETSLKLGDPRSAYQAYSMVDKLDAGNLDAKLKIAMMLLLGGKFSESREKVEAVLRAEPDSTEALFLLAALQEQDQNLYDAASTFEKIIDFDPNNTKAHIGLARALSVQGKFQEAEKILEAAIDIAPKDIQLRLALFGLYGSRKEPDRAEETLKKAIEIEPNNSDLFIIQGNYYFKLNRRKDAESAYLKAVEVAPANVKPCMVAGGFYDAVGDKDRTLAMYRKALDLQSDNVQILETIARFHFKHRELNETEKYIGLILEKRPKYPSTQLLQAELLVAKREFDSAIQILDLLIKEDTKSARAHYFKGLAQIGKGERRIAKASVAEAVELDARFVKARLLICELNFSERNFSMAEKEAGEILRMLPKYYPARLIEGNSLLMQGKGAEAEKAYGDLTEWDPKNPVGFYRLGLLYRMQKKHDLAMEQFEKALSINPALMDVFSNIVLVHMEKREYGKAIRRIDQRLDKEQGNADVLAILNDLKGDVYAVEGKTEQALEAYDAAINHHEGYLKPYYALVGLYIRENKTDLAVSKLMKVLESDPRQIKAKMLLGTIYDMQKKYDLSEKYYRDVLELNPGFAPAANNLAFLLADQDKNIDEALSLARMAREKLTDEPSVKDTLGWVYFKKGLYDSAISEFTESLEKLPNNGVVHYHLGLAYYKKGEKEKARAELEKAIDLKAGFDYVEHSKKILSEL